MTIAVDSPEAGSPAPDFPVFDVDNHLYETEDALTRHLPAAHRDLFRFVELNGRKKLVVRSLLTEYIPNPTFEVVARPGSHMAFYASENPEGKSLRELAGKPMRTVPAFREPAARLALMDEQGLDTCLMFPTLASLIEERLRDDPRLTDVAIHAFNEWLHDDWTYDYQGRIFATPIITPTTPEAGVRELETVLGRGAKVVLMRPAPVTGSRGPRSPFLPEFDPFWARVQESGVIVALHASDSGYQEYLNTWEGRDGEFVAFKPKTFAYVADGGRSIQDTLASAICHGMLDRFPGVRLVSVENGGSWVGVLAKNLELTYKKMPQEFQTHPLELLRRNVWINPFWEDSLDGLIGLMGTDRVCFGSDYPHAEGLAEPLSFLDRITDLPPADVERIMSTNLADLLGVTRSAPAAGTA
ncbi:amidohydrolase family protein [Frankia sp. AgB1.9]|uniref:amidohydrolase family protein n=1 Tax=unclassified Frankia TaxID=2632575 RepID=UPI00193169CE|nr:MULTISPECIES: amidohydrolase family protein [unclassified Frankia]MBL7488690.1 amidohydrolase family protein [Frankia sp. AgW1.1]MBL7547840.1 amidohydrolase family protein [Frankia sp. AgB1.9]MBL7622034.1 amidohydrolase family protein [Frankia sp. AgB1.8]